MKKLMVDLTDEQHAKFKAACALKQVPMREPVVRAIEAMTAGTILELASVQAEDK